MERATQAHDRGDHEDALRLFSRALGENAHSEAAWVGQLRCLVALEEYEEAGAWAVKALDYLPGSPAVMAVQALAAVLEGNRERAMQIVDRALKAPGCGPFVWLSRAWALGRTRPKPADMCVQKALETGSSNVTVLTDAAGFYMANERFGDAMRLLRQATSRRPALPPPWYNLGICYLRLGLQSQAVDALKQAASLAPGNLDYQAALAEASGQSAWTAWWRRTFGK